jgi:WD40 repeat protein
MGLAVACCRFCQMCWPAVTWCFGTTSMSHSGKVGANPLWPFLCASNASDMADPWPVFFNNHVNDVSDAWWPIPNIRINSRLVCELTGPLVGLMYSLRGSPDGRFVAACNRKGGLWVWDSHTNNWMELDGRNTQLVHRLRWAPNCSHIACVSNYPDIRVWNVSERRISSIFHGPGQHVECAEWSRDGSQLASGYWDTNIRLWQLGNNKCTRVLRGHDDTVLCVAWSCDDTQLASGCNDSSVRLWIVSSGECTRIITRRDARVLYEPSRFVVHLRWLGKKDNERVVWQELCKPLLAVDTASQSPPYVVGDASEDSRLVCRSPRSDYTVTVRIGCITVSDTAHYKLCLPIKCYNVNDIAWMKNGKQIAVLTEYGELLLITVCQWCDRVHHLFSSEFKALVFCLMCIRGRISATNRPQLPMYIWLDLFATLVNLMDGHIF